MKRWLVIVIDDIEPYIHGPFDSEETRSEWAKYHRFKDPEKKDGIYKLNTHEGGSPTIKSYSGGFFEGMD